MKTLLATGLSLAMLSGPAALAVDDVAHATKHNLRVLYAGKLETARTSDFERFLGENFANVGTMSLEKFTPSAADAYDVVILDWVSIYPRDDDGKIIQDNFMLKTPNMPQLPMDYDRPTIVIGSVAGAIRRPGLQLKMDWL